MKLKEHYWIAGFTLTLLFFFYGVYLYNQAAFYTPPTPGPVPPRHYTFSHHQRKLPLSRYTRLLQGELFFGKTPPPPVSPFQSNLKIYGIIRGKNPRAVVGLAGSDQTWVVKPGAIVGGEKIVTIGEKYLVVRNESGQGRITN